MITISYKTYQKYIVMFQMLISFKQFQRVISQPNLSDGFIYITVWDKAIHWLIYHKKSNIWKKIQTNVHCRIYCWCFISIYYSSILNVGLYLWGSIITLFYCYYYVQDVSTISSSLAIWFTSYPSKQTFLNSIEITAISQYTAPVRCLYSVVKVHTNREARP